MTLDDRPPGAGGRPCSSFGPEADLAVFLLRQRRRRAQMLGAQHFADPVWDMMLDLFVARVRSEATATTSLVIAASVPQSTALRRIRELVHSGDFVAYADPSDGRRTFITLSDPLFETLATLLREWRAPNATPRPTN